MYYLGSTTTNAKRRFHSWTCREMIKGRTSRRRCSGRCSLNTW